MATFRKNTYVRDANGVSVKFVIGQEAPDWAVKAISNPHILDGVDSTPEDPKPENAAPEAAETPVAQVADEDEAPAKPKARAPRRNTAAAKAKAD